MKYCCRWNNQLQHEFDYDELIIDYEGISQAPALVKFLKGHSYQRIIINVLKTDNIDVNVFSDLRMQYNCRNFAVRLPDYFTHVDMEKVAALATAALPFFFNTVVSSLDVMAGFANLGVSDILIGNELGFSLSKVAHYCHERDIKVRVYPNIAQSLFPDTPNLKCFFVRPEDALMYDTCVDVYEFYQLPGNERTNPDALWDIYAGTGNWAGPLGELILYFDADIDNRTIFPDFGQVRFRCGKRCLKDTNCTICPNVLLLSDVMKQEKKIFEWEGRP